MNRMLLLILTLLLALDAATVRASSASAPAPVTLEAGPSLYPLSLELRDQDGAATSLDAFRGHPVIVTMFYGSCPIACPLLVTRIREIEAALPEEARADLRVLVVSFDPEHDTPGALRAIAKQRGLELSRWKLATAPDDDVRQLAAALGISYHRLPEGGFTHSSVLTVLDRDGRPVARSEDLADTRPLIRAVMETR